MEQYRLLALLPLEDAKVLQRRLREMDKSLSAAVARSLARTTIPDGSSDDGDPDAESVEGSDRLLLADLVALSGECEELGAIARNRLEAALAYGEVVKGRMARLQITHGGGYGTRNLAGVVLRRLEPALRTYGVTIRQLKSTTSSIRRATILLNTKVSIRVERQQSRLVKIGTVLSVLSLIAGLFEFAERTSRQIGAHRGGGRAGRRRAGGGAGGDGEYTTGDSGTNGPSFCDCATVGAID